MQVYVPSGFANICLMPQRRGEHRGTMEGPRTALLGARSAVSPHWGLGLGYVRAAEQLCLQLPLRAPQPIHLAWAPVCPAIEALSGHIATFAAQA